jgi:exopolyphosphatase/pppGpp-phosphohydrolase
VNPGLDPQRADVIVAGCCILVAIFRHWGFDECLVSEADILDGLALSLLD